MRCQFCHGTGWSDNKETPVAPRIPCSECGGTGIGHCCDGIICNEQPLNKSWEEQYSPSTKDGDYAQPHRQSPSLEPPA